MTVQKIKSGNSYNQGGGVVYASKTGLITAINPPKPMGIDTPPEYIFAYDNAKYVDISASSGSPVVVDAIPGHSIKLINYTLLTPIAQSVKWQSNTTDLSGAMSLDANGGIAQDSKDGLLETSQGEALRLMPSSSGVVSGHIAYMVT